MGTLGCINDMMRRDKENRELRKAGKERLNAVSYTHLDVYKRQVQRINIILKEVKKKYRLKIKNFSCHSLRKTFGRQVYRCV